MAEQDNSREPINRSYSQEVFNTIEDANFSSRVFSDKGGTFQRSDFKQFANFKKSRLEGTAIDFSDAQFRNGVSFINVIFPIKPNFGSSKFYNPGENKFNNTKPTKKFGGHFRKAIFKTSVNFANAGFAGRMCFTETEFNEGALFEAMHFYGEVDFSRADFGGQGGDFRGVRFHKFAKFDGIKNNGLKIDFSGAHFLAGASFSGANLKGFDFTNTTFKETISFQNCIIEEPKLFEKTTFEVKEIDFSDAEFQSGVFFAEKKFNSDVKFNKTVFTGFANFEKAEFYKGNVDFSNAVFLAGVSFKNAQFGKDYQRTFGEWEIRFSKDVNYNVKAKKITETEDKWEKFFVPQFIDLLQIKGIEKFKDNILQEFDKFKTHLLLNVNFSHAQFDNSGDIDFTGAIFNNNENVDFQYATFSNNGDVNFENAIFSNLGNVFFQQTKLNNRKDIFFASVRFRNEGIVAFVSTEFKSELNVFFSNVSFKNSQSVYFNFAKFCNNLDVNFSSTIFSNLGNVEFSSATFSNRGKVKFTSFELRNHGSFKINSTTFSNTHDVDFSSSIFSNDGDVDFSSSIFKNNWDVNFSRSIFGNIGNLKFTEIIWINNEGLYFSSIKFIEKHSVKFAECLFLSRKGVFLCESMFPEKGSLMFQRCYFGRTRSVDFTRAFFRHTSFEGGEITWLKESPEKILRKRLSEKYDSLPDKTKRQLKTGLTPVFENGVEVLWKDLTTESAKNLTLRRVNLSHSLFDSMTLSHIQLNAPKWLEEDGRRYLYEEKKLRKDVSKNKTKFSKFDLENIEDQYTQLKNNLEKQGNYLNAGYFHYGEQEIRREILWRENWHSLPLPRNIFPRILSCFYKWCSGYGERPGLALITTCCLILLFSSVLAIWNINSNLLNPLNLISAVADKPFPFGWLMVFEDSQLLVNLLKTVSCSRFPSELFRAFVELITPFSWKGSESLIQTFNKSGFELCRMFFLVVFQFITLAIQAPLLVLAVRRRFKR